MITLLIAVQLGVVQDMDLPLHCICASHSEILCVDRSLARYAVITKQAVTRRKIRPHWHPLPGTFLDADPLSPSGFALLYQRPKVGLTYANLRAGKLTESLIPAKIADSKNDLAEYVGRDLRGRPYACFGGGHLTPRMVRYDKGWKEVGNPYLMGDGHVATNEFPNPIPDENGDITHLNAYRGSRHLTWKVPKGLTAPCDRSSGNLTGCSPVVTAGDMESADQRESYFATLLETGQATISRCRRDLTGWSVIVLDPRHLLLYNGKFRILRLKLLWKS